MFINMDLGGVKEAKPVPAGRYDLTIASAEEHTSKDSGGKSVKISIGIDGHDDSPNIMHFMALPKAGDDPTKANFKTLMIKRFLKQFGVIYNENEGFNVEDLPGCTAKAQVTLSEPDDNGNVYNRIQLDRLKD